MTIDWQHFTPWASLTGGLLIGVSVTLFLLLNGRVLGVSGIVGGLLRRAPADKSWRLLFLAGLMVSPWLMSWVRPMPPARIDASWVVLIAAGLLVGWGTSLGSGCTSGHGVCGLSRLSPRSLVATVAFMAMGIAIVFIVRHLLT